MRKEDDVVRKETDTRVRSPSGRVNRLCAICTNRCVQDERYVVVRCPKWRPRD